MSGTGEDPKTDRLGKDYEEGPNPAPGGTVEPGGEVPPYEGRTDGSDQPSPDDTSAARQAATGDHSGGGTASPAVESPVTDDDEMAEGEPDSPKGVGENVNTRGEDQAR